MNGSKHVGHKFESSSSSSSFSFSFKISISLCVACCLGLKSACPSEDAAVVVEVGPDTDVSEAPMAASTKGAAVVVVVVVSCLVAVWSKLCSVLE